MYTKIQKPVARLISYVKRHAKWFIAVGCGLLILLRTAQLFEYELDDAYIYYRYAQNVISGNGIVFNPGERINGLASMLYLLLLLPGELMGATPVYAHILTGVLCFGLAYLSFHLWSKRGLLPEGFVTALFIALYIPFHKTIGLEMPLFLLVFTCAQLMVQKPYMFMTCIALLPSIRSEGILLLPLSLLVLWLGKRHNLTPNLTKRKITIAISLAVLLVVVLYLLLYAYFGDPLPHSFYAKRNQGLSGKWGASFTFGTRLIELFCDKRMIPLLVVAILGLMNSQARSRLWSVWLLIGGYCILLLFGYSVLSIPPYRWYFLPFELLILHLSACGVGYVLRFIHTHQSGFVPVISGGMIIICFWIYSSQGPAAPQFEHFRQERIEPYKEVARYLAANSPETASIGLDEIGVIGYYSKRKVIDFLGIITPWSPDTLRKKDFLQQFMTAQPDFILAAFPLNNELYYPVWHYESLSLQLYKKAIR